MVRIMAPAPTHVYTATPSMLGIMPKLVNHEARRNLIVETTWRIIARQGFQSTTMREISTEMGLTHGALNHYFASKDDLLLASYEYVFDRTNKRIEARLGNRRGLEALQAMAEEMMPLGDEQRLEARVVLPFWERCVTSERFAAVHGEGMEGLTSQFVRFLEEAVVLGEATQNLDVPKTARTLLGLISGMQVLAVLTSSDYPPRVLKQMLEDFLDDCVAHPRREHSE